MSVWSDAAAIVTAAAAVTVASAGYVQFVLKRSVLPSADFDVEFTPHVLGPEHLVGEVEAVVRNVGPNMLIATNVKCRVRYRLVGDADVVFSEEPTEPAFRHRVVSLGGGTYGGPLLSSPGPSLPLSSQPRAAPSQPRSPAMPQTPPSSPSSSPAASAASGVIARPSIPSQGVADTPGEEAAASTSADDWFPLVSSRTFIQPGVVQRYRKPIVLPAMTQLVHVWASFDYHNQLGAVRKFLIRLLARPPKGQLVLVEGREVWDLDWRQGIRLHTVRRTFSVTPPALAVT
jgi:hypothetical protein